MIIGGAVQMASGGEGWVPLGPIPRGHFVRGVHVVGTSSVSTDLYVPVEIRGFVGGQPELSAASFDSGESLIRRSATAAIGESVRVPLRVQNFLPLGLEADRFDWFVVQFGTSGTGQFDCTAMLDVGPPDGGPSRSL